MTPCKLSSRPALNSVLVCRLDSAEAFELTMPATQSYLLPVPNGGTVKYCGVAVNNAELGGITIIGASVLRAYLTVLDEGNSKVGFVPQTYCK